MNSTEMQGFFADEGSIDSDEYVIFTYVIETRLDTFEAAANLCRETSTAQWKRPGVDEDFRPRHAAKVLTLEVVDESAPPTFAPSSGSERCERARVRIAHPCRNFGPKIPNLLTVAMGEGAFFCEGISSIKLLDVDFPDSYLAAFEGPRFGIEGLRDLLGVHGRPLFFGVVKPNIGLDPESFAKLASDAWVGGLDAAKDDEMLADVEYSPFAERMRCVGEAMREAEGATGEKKMFIANITDEVDNLVRLHDVAVKNGINAVMVNAVAVGLSALRMLCKHASVPIVGHFDCIAPMSRHPNFGVSSTVLTKFQRLCGCDAIIMPGFGERMMTPEEEVIANASECASALGEIKRALPVPGGSDWAGTLPVMYEKLRTLDFAMVPGRGVFGHPQGPRAGAMSLRQAWEAVEQRLELAEYAKDHDELREAMSAFGSGSNSRGAVFKHVADDRPPIVRGFTGAQLLIGRSGRG